MRKLIIILFTIFIASNLFGTVNGQLTEVNNQKILKVWGTHYERGYAEGFLLGENIKDVFVNYVFTFVFSHNSAFYGQSVSLVTSSFNFEEKYCSEFEGIIAGMNDAGVDMYVNGLNRNMDVDDLKLSNSLIDLTTFFSKNELFQGKFGCSSLVSWGESTADDPELQGQLVISRLLDWTPNASLIENSLLKISYPSEPDEQKWASFTYPSLIGGLTAFNQSKIFCELNMGNVHTCNSNSFTPVLLDIRDGLESVDYNQDSICDGEDIWSSVSNHAQSSGYIILVANPITENEEPFYIEVNNIGIARRTIEDNTHLHGNNIASTNHFRKLYPPVPGPRYVGLINATNQDSTLTIDENFSTLATTCGTNYNMMTIQYLPSLNEIKWGIYGDSPAYLEESFTYDIDELFDFSSTSTSDLEIPKPISKIRVYPNPVNLSDNYRGTNTTILFNLPESGNVELSIFNIKGQIVKTLLNKNLSKGENKIHWNGLNNLNSPVPNGIYFVNLKYENVSHTQKILVIK